MKIFFDGNARMIEFPRLMDDRGTLVPVEFSALPFSPCRSFVISGVAAGTIRGGHAHRSCRQILVCPEGQIDVLMRFDGEEVSIRLDRDEHGLLVEPGVWSQQRYIADGSVLLVFASEPFDPGSYIPNEN